MSPVDPPVANDVPTRAATPLRRNRDYTLLQTGATISAVGSGMSGLAFLLLGYALTHSSARAGLASASFALGQLALMLPAGALVDRWNRRRTMAITTGVGAVAFATIPLASHWGHLTYAHLLVVAFVEGTLGCFYGPAERAALKRIVAPEQLGTAASVTIARSSLGSLVGPPLSGVLYGIARTLPFTADAASYLAAALCAWAVRTPLPAPERSATTSVVGDVREGLTWVWHTPAVRDLVAIALPINLALNGILTVAVLDLQRRGTSPHALGLLESAAGLAALLAALVAPAVISRVRIGVVTLVGVLVVVVLGCLMVASASIWWVGAVIATMMVVIMPLNAGINAFEMHITPEDMQGRSAAASSFVSMAMIPVATAASGVLLQHQGRTTAMLTFAALFGVALVVALASRAVRTIPTTRALSDAV